MSDFVNDFDDIVSSYLTALRFPQPAVVTSYNSADQTVCVLPVFRRELANGEIEEPQIVEDVPICYPDFGAWSVCGSIAEGTKVLLISVESDLGEWLNSTGDEPINPSLDDRSGLSSIVAIPGLRTKRDAISAPVDGVAIRNTSNSLFLQITDAGVEIKGDVLVTGDLTVIGDVKASATPILPAVPSVVSLLTHVHPAGTPNTGAPVLSL